MSGGILSAYQLPGAHLYITTVHGIKYILVAEICYNFRKYRADNVYKGNCSFLTIVFWEIAQEYVRPSILSVKQYLYKLFSQKPVMEKC